MLCPQVPAPVLAAVAVGPMPLVPVPPVRSVAHLEAARRWGQHAVPSQAPQRSRCR